MKSVQERHRPGVLKQQNKSHKHGRHRSKGAIHDALKGRISAKTTTKKAARELHREERRNQAMQLRQKKREEMLLKKRFSSGIGSNHPLLLSVVPLSEKIDPLGVLELLKQADSEAVINTSSIGNAHISIPRLKQRFTIVCPRHGDLYGVLDALKVSDTVLFLLSADEAEGLDAAGEVLLTAAMAQGLPTPIVAVTHLNSVPIKKQHDRKNHLQKIFSRWLPDMKIMTLDKCDEALNVLRRAGSQKLRSVTYRDHRPHMLVEEMEFVENAQEGDYGTLKVSGYLRGHALSVNGLLHIPNWGDFQMEKIEAPSDPYPISEAHKKHSQGEETRLLEEADPSKQESLLSENPLDPMDAEQTWPTAEEIAEAEKEQKAQRLVKRVPKGMSDYQAAWIPDCDAEVDSDEESDVSENPAMDAQSEMSSENGFEENDDEYETVSVSEAGEDAEKYDEKMDMEEEKETLKKLKEAREDKIFPDERDTPQDIPARTRFQKYRGLQSFRTSPWDPKENLPQDYARIFQFENFERMRKRLLKTDDMEGALVGWYITVHVKNVPRHFIESHKPSHPLTIFGLLPHEQKMSLLNVVLKRPNTLGGQLPIKSKEQLIIHCGYRRFKVCPIFSQHTNGTKHKYERFFQPDTTVVASMYAPIMFPPCPVLAFKETKGSQMLVGVGSVLSINPDRIVVKRIVLSGHPIKVNKRSAVVRYMFFNREDINWFKPVELHTKYGRRGHIKEPLGTHGHMKCVFDGQLKSQDTVLMNLYKRIFPKWTYDPYVRSPHPLYNYSDLMSVDEVD